MVIAGIYVRLSACVTLGLLLLVSAGCGSSGRSKGSSPADDAAETKAAAAKAVTEIEDQLKSALYQLQPENLQIDSNLEDATSVLNNWWAAAQAANLTPTVSPPPELTAERLSEEQLAELNRKGFSLDEGQYIRNCYLSRKVSQQLGTDTANETERVVAIFDWVCRNITLRGLDETPYPVTIYEAYVIGRGQPVDRAMVFAGILKQLRIDAVILSPSRTDAPPSTWWVGVLLGDQVVLFDPRLGLPVPRGDRPDPFQTPASLAELTAHPEWLTLLATKPDQPAAWTTDDLQNLKIATISEPAAWSKRMWALEQMLPSESIAVLYDPPATIEQLPGSFDRVAAAFPGKTATEISLWGHAQKIETWFKSLNQLEVRALQGAMVAFIVPVEYEPPLEAGGQPRRVETKRQLRFRTEQLFGRRSQTLANYMTIRQLSVMQPPEAQLGPVYQRAADDAFYWSAVCKYESGEYETCAQFLTDYLKRYRRGGQWIYAARQLLADAQLKLGHREEALKLWKVQESDDPHRDRNVLMLKRMAAITPAAGETPAATESSPSESSPSEPTPAEPTPAEPTPAEPTPTDPAPAAEAAAPAVEQPE
jgi:transglutaminase-like putative cysteine protease